MLMKSHDIIIPMQIYKYFYSISYTFTEVFQRERERASEGIDLTGTRPVPTLTSFFSTIATYVYLTIHALTFILFSCTRERGNQSVHS